MQVGKLQAIEPAVRHFLADGFGRIGRRSRQAPNFANVPRYRARTASRHCTLFAQHSPTGTLNLLIDSHPTCSASDILCRFAIAAALAAIFSVADAQSTNQPVTDSTSADVAQAEPEIVGASPDVHAVGRDDTLSVDGISLELVEEILRLGAPQLAHDILRSQFPPRDDAGKWIEWEKKFYEIAQRVRGWQSILDRAGGVATDLPLELFKIAQTSAIRSEIELGRGNVARLRARHMIWNVPYDIEFALKWRELVIQSYLADELYDDVRVAMAGFSKDYRPNDPQWEHRYARILILTGNREEAVARIAGLQTVEARMLNLYAQFIGKSAAPAQIVEQLLEMLPEMEQNSPIVAELWAVVRVIAASDQDTETRVIAAENGLPGHGGQSAPVAPVVPLTSAFDLLEAYDEHAIEIGNSYGLVIGDDENWHQRAQEFDILAPPTARAIYAFLSVNAAQAQWRSTAAKSLAAALIQAELPDILELLVVEEKFIRLQDVAPPDRNALIDWVIRKRDYATASLIMSTMADPPQDIDAHSWQLRRARVALLAGDTHLGISILRQLTARLQPPLDGELIDRVVQVIFDLQDLGQHETAVELTDSLYEKSADKLQKRELLHWSAESYSALEQHLKAARLFLRSATLGEDWNDDWGRSVQYRAALELTQAGYVIDARRILSTLKQLTFDPRTRAVIDDRLRELRALQARESDE